MIRVVKLLRGPLGLALVGVLAMGLLLWALGAISSGKGARVEARLNASRADAAISSGADAAQSVGRQASTEQAADAVTKENDRAIHQAPGADAPVAGTVHGAGLDSLCRRAAYRNSQQCLQRASP
jgi:hypothetical protein